MHGQGQPEEDHGRVRGKFIPKFPVNPPRQHREDESRNGPSSDRDASGPVSVVLRVKRRRDDAPLEVLLVEGRSTKRPSICHAMQTLSVAGETPKQTKLFRLLKSVPAKQEEEERAEEGSVDKERREEAGTKETNAESESQQKKGTIAKKSVLAKGSSSLKADEHVRSTAAARKRESALSALKAARASATGSRRFGDADGIRVVDVDLNLNKAKQEGEEKKAQTGKQSVQSKSQERRKAEIVDDSDLEEDDDEELSRAKERKGEHTTTCAKCCLYGM
jgi:hypothetical protein